MLLGRVARMYYEHGMTHQEIADSLGLSRIRVTRLLAEARDKGLVEIIVHVEESLFADEERDLASRFGLRQVWIAPNMPDQSKENRAFATVGAEALASVIEKNASVALALSTAVALAASEFPRRPLSASFVPVAGSGSGLVNGANPHEIAATLATRTSGQAFHLPAPLLAADPSSAASFYADPGVQKMLDLAKHADVLVVGVGGMGLNEGLLLRSLTDAQQKMLVEAGAVGDIAGRFYDASGAAVEGDLDARIIGLKLDNLKEIPNRLGISRGATRVDSLRAALGSGLVNMLVTDINTASALLH